MVTCRCAGVPNQKCVWYFWPVSAILQLFSLLKFRRKLESLYVFCVNHEDLFYGKEWIFGITDTCCSNPRYHNSIILITGILINLWSMYHKVCAFAPPIHFVSVVDLRTGPSYQRNFMWKPPPLPAATGNHFVLGTTFRQIAMVDRHASLFLEQFFIHV